MSFVHLHVHSSFSVLDGFGSPAGLVARAKELGMPALALTDHGTMFGTLNFFNAAVAAGIKPIIGLETYLAPRSMLDKDVQKDKYPYHLVLLAENMTGYQNLLKIASAAQLEGFYYHPRIDKAFLSAHSQGLIAASACLSGEIPRALLDNDQDRALRALNWYLDVFGKDRFYLELQDHNIPELYRINRGLVQLAQQTQAKLIATNDVHYIKKEDAEMQDILLCVQTGRLLSDKNRMRMNDDSYYLRSPDEMKILFAQVPEAISNTLEIAERCEIDLTRKGYHLPQFELPEGEDSRSYLLELCQRGLQQRISDRAESEEVQKRLDYELGIINQMGFDEYFLIVWDLCRFSRDRNIWYNVRGSGNGSLVAFALEITSVEPLSHRLLFERFLNPDRVTMPDIDLDFQDDRRAEVMEYCNQKYGADKVAQIITFGTLAARGAVRDVGRVMNIPLAEVDRVAKLVPGPIQGKAVPIMESLKTSPELKAAYESSELIKKLIETAGRMEGALRNVGTHAAGVIISDKPLTDYLPLHRPTSQSEDLPIKSVAQYDMDGINTLGLLKVDFLGLVTLTIMAKACEYIEQRHGIKFTLDSIPTDDPEVYNYISEGRTMGLFQLEGSGMTRYLMQMRPTTVHHVIAMCALFRPGPMEIIPEYIDNMHGIKPVSYQHEKLKSILEETYGHAVYQEQIMLAAMELAGYTPGESDDLRSAISKKKVKEVKKHHNKFIKGAVEHGIDKKIAEEIFAHWEAFAHYGFNKSHATNYGMIAVKTAYLKYHYPVEYMTALVSAWKNDTDKCATYVADCRAMGIDVLPPDVNYSCYDFTIEDRPGGKGAIRFGLGAIKNVGQNPVEMIMKARVDRPFKDINDFVRRVDLRGVGKRPLECLIKVGSLDSLGPRIALLRAIEQMVNISASHFNAIDMGQMALFGGTADVISQIILPDVPGLNSSEQLEWEKELLGLYVTDNPMSAYMKRIKDRVSHTANMLAEAEDMSAVAVGGMVKRYRSILTRKQDTMAFVTLEDNFGEYDVVMFPSVWERSNHMVDNGSMLIVNGKVQHQERGISVLADTVTRVEINDLEEENDSRNQGPFFERMLERYLPDLRVLSRFAWREDQPEQASDFNLHPEPHMPVDELMQDFMEEEIFDDPEWDLDEFPSTAEDIVITKFVEEKNQILETQPETEDDQVEKPIIKKLDSLETQVVTPPVEEAPKAYQHKKRLIITYLPCGNRERDLRHIQHIHGLLSSHPGEDHFSLLVPENGKQVEIDFPNSNVELSEKLISELGRFVGKDHISVY